MISLYLMRGMETQTTSLLLEMLMTLLLFNLLYKRSNNISAQHARCPLRGKVGGLWIFQGSAPM